MEPGRANESGTPEPEPFQMRSGLIFAPRNQKTDDVVKPVLQALLVADHVYIDKVTNKKVIAGVFHHLFFRKVQDVQQVNEEEKTIRLKVLSTGYQNSSPFCYISLTEVHGKQPFSLRYVRLADDKLMFQTEFEVDCPSPLETVEIVLPLPNLPADDPGVYALELLWSQEPLGSHRISVAEAKEESE